MLSKQQLPNLIEENGAFLLFSTQMRSHTNGRLVFGNYIASALICLLNFTRENACYVAVYDFEISFRVRHVVAISLSIPIG